MKLVPVLKDYIWGGTKLRQEFNKPSSGVVAESWEVSTHPDGLSVIANGDYRGLTLAEFIKNNPHAARGYTDLPVLVKLIDAAQNLSVQVHPGDEFAKENEGDNGKTEMWYVVDALPGAGIYCGLSRAVTSAELERAASDGSITGLLRFVKVKPGDAFLIEAGTLHAIGAGVTICEVQQSSNVTYRVFDYNRTGADGKPRQLHLDKALLVSNLGAHVDRTGTESFRQIDGGRIRLLTSCKYFSVQELELSGRAELELGGWGFTAFTVLSGGGSADCGGTAEKFIKGDSFFVPCGARLNLEGKGRILLTKPARQSVYIGMDLGGTNVKAGLIDGSGKLLKKSSIKTGRERPYAQIAEDMANQAIALAKACGFDAADIAAVGVGSPGTVDSKNGVIVYSNNIRWDDVPLGRELSSRLNAPVYILNDANAAALGEAAFGAGKSYGSSVLLTLGTGVGGGIVLGGEVFEGYKSAGAEAGHTVIVSGGEECTCGRFGCLEAYASATALIRDTKRAMESHKDSLMWEISGGTDGVDGATAFSAMKRSDAAAAAVVDDYIRYLGEGIVNFVNMLRPEAVILGGGVCNEGDALLVPLRKFVEANVYGGMDYAPVKLVVAELGNDAGLMGAYQFARTRAEKG